MRSTSVLCIAFATAVALGCNRDRPADAVSGSPNPNPGAAAVGTAGELDRNKAAAGDTNFVNDLVIANMAEVELGKMAAARSTNAEVKTFGSQMVADHTAAGDKLKAVASQHDIPVPAALDDKHRDLRDKLAKLQGSDFDREYMDAMVSGHKAVIDTLESRIDKDDLGKWKTEMSDQQTGKTVVAREKAVAVRPEQSDRPATMAVNQWAADSYPVVQSHLDMAKRIDNGLKNRSTTR
jgi:putative membrane protein